MTTLSTYLTIVNHESQYQAAAAQTPAVQLATKYFEQNIGSVTSAKQLVANPRLLDYALTAYGLSSYTNEQGLVSKALQQGVLSSSALANTLNNTNLRNFVKAFDFADNGSSAVSSSTVTDAVNAYVENNLETTQGQQDPGVQLALYFQNHASSITNVYNILADKSLLTVVQTALGISSLSGLEPIDTQASQISAKLNLSDFQDPTKVQKFIERFAASYDANNSSSGSSSSSASGSSSVLSLFQNINTGGGGISSSTLLSAANIHLGLL
jgi:hypothetical protein